MTCEIVTLEGGGRAFVCTSRRRPRCACGRVATRACDWKVPERSSGTCDVDLCPGCTTKPARHKDLCPAHAAAYADWLARRE